MLISDRIRRMVAGWLRSYRIMCHVHPLRWVAVKLPKLHLEVEDDWPRKQVRHVERCAEAVLLRPAPKHLV